MGDIITKTKEIIRKILPPVVMLIITKWRLSANAKKWDLNIIKYKPDSDRYWIINKGNMILISSKHLRYIDDLMGNFNFYYSSVKPVECGGFNVVDFTTPRLHWVTGFELFPILFPSFAEPITTTQQYIELADFKNGDVVFDLGAYSGLTSIMFDMAIPGGGCVIALEADHKNLGACIENISRYEKIKNRKIELVYAAVWNDDGGVTFSSEGNLGSSVVSGNEQSGTVKVPSLTLLQIADKFQLTHVDFIKCDIEGGETVIFDCPQFFSRFSPKILIGCHLVGGISSSALCRKILSKYGYTFEEVKEQGYPLPLLLCKCQTIITDVMKDNMIIDLMEE